MELRITPFSTLSPSINSSTKSKPSSAPGSLNPGTFTPGNKLQPYTQTQPSPEKELTASSLFFIRSNTEINKPALSISTQSNRFQPAALADKKGVLLYQQIERNKLFSNGAELINRFNFKV